MALQWKPTFPEDDNPEDVTGSLRHFGFARVSRIRSGPEANRFRWYLNEVPGYNGIRHQGIEDSLELAKQSASAEFHRWLEWVGLRPAPVAAEAEGPTGKRPAAESMPPKATVFPPEERLPRYLASLCEGLARYHQDAGPELDQIYSWKIPPLPDGIDFDPGSESLAQANMRLKRTLSATWHAQPHRQFEIAEWYVARWGGVRSNREETLRAYVSQLEEDLVGQGARGVATYSKVLAIRNPDQYAIFDARVATALNALQLIQEHERPILFPSLPSKNTTVQEFQAWMQAQEFGGAHQVFQSRVYSTYLRVLREVARKLDLKSLDSIEMVLFAKAENLAREAMTIRPA